MSEWLAQLDINSLLVGGLAGLVVAVIAAWVAFRKGAQGEEAVREEKPAGAVANVREPERALANERAKERRRVGVRHALGPEARDVGGERARPGRALVLERSHGDRSQRHTPAQCAHAEPV